MIDSTRKVLSMIKFSHSIFALPFALQAAWLAAGGRPAWDTLLWIVLAAVCARTAAMSFNRWVDRDVDADNPRTAGREIPAGVLSANFVLGVVAVASAAFIAAAFQLNALSGWLSLPVLAVLFSYSGMKRVHFSAHLVLGLCLALAPLAAWIAVTGSVSGLAGPVAFLALAVLTWVAGFDLIYACQDAHYDQEAGLHSIPARFGIAGALRFSRTLHLITVLSLAAFTWTAGLSWIYWIAVAMAAGLLFYEQSLVKPHDLSRVNLAFFTLNGWIGVLLFVGLVLDMGMLPGGHAS